MALLGLWPGAAAGAGLATGIAAVTMAWVKAADILYLEPPMLPEPAELPELEVLEVVEECV